MPPRMPRRLDGFMCARAPRSWHELLIRLGVLVGEPLPHRFEQLGQPLAARAGDAQERQSELRRAAFERGDAIRIVDGVHLVRRDDLRLRGERRVKQLELLAHGVEIAHRVAAGRARDVDQVHEHLRPLEMAEELVAEALSAMSAFNQAGHVGDREAAVAAQAHDTQIRRQRRERIVRDLRTGRGDPRDQRRLARRSGSPPARHRRAASSRAAAACFRPASRARGVCGARLVDDAKRALPRPPSPPRATSTRSPSCVRSASSRRGESGASVRS